MIVLSLHDVSVSYGDKKVLDSLSLHVNRGEVVSVLGPSGVGKTTLFEAIAGLVELDGGEITMLDSDASHVAYMLQKDLLFEHKTVWENAALPLLIQGVKKAQAKETVLPYLDTFGLSDTENLYPHQLSGGMRQRVAFLRTFMMGKELILLDEPFSALDTITRSQMQKWYLELKSQLQITTFLVTHDIDEAILMSDRILILNHQPGVITDAFQVNQPSPRSADFSTSQEFIDLKKQILAVLDTNK